MARDRHCTPDITELGSPENNSQFLFQRLVLTSYQDATLSTGIRNLAEVLTTRRSWIHEQIMKVEESCCKQVIVRNLRALIQTWKLELLADNCTIATLADEQALASIRKDDSEDLMQTISCPFATGLIIRSTCGTRR